MFGIETKGIVSIAKKVISEILKWIWEKIKEWANANMAKVAVAILLLVVVILFKLLVLKVQLGPMLVQAGVLSP